MTPETNETVIMHGSGALDQLLTTADCFSSMLPKGAPGSFQELTAFVER